MVALIFVGDFHKSRKALSLTSSGYESMPRVPSIRYSWPSKPCSRNVRLSIPMKFRVRIGWLAFACDSRSIHQLLLINVRPIMRLPGFWRLSLKSCFASYCLGSMLVSTFMLRERRPPWNRHLYIHHAAHIFLMARRSQRLPLWHLNQASTLLSLSTKPDCLYSQNTRRISTTSVPI